MAKKEDDEQAPETISKMEAVRRILGDNPATKPKDGVATIKTQYGLEMSPSNFSAYKSQIRTKAAERPQASEAPKNKGGRPKGSGKKASAAGVSEADPLEAAQQVKALVERYGAGTVKGLAELFGR
jgi:hypothetical protein